MLTIIDTLNKGLGNSLILKRKGLVLNGVTLMVIQTTKTAPFLSQLQWFLCSAMELFIFLLPCILITSFLDNMAFQSPFISSCNLVSGLANRKNQIMTTRKSLKKQFQLNPIQINVKLGLNSSILKKFIIKDPAAQRKKSQ